MPLGRSVVDKHRRLRKDRGGVWWPEVMSSKLEGGYAVQTTNLSKLLSRRNEAS